MSPPPLRAEAQVRIDLAAAYRLAACGGELPGAAAELAELTCRQWVGDGSERDGDVEWPAQLRRLDRLAPGYRD